MGVPVQSKPHERRTSYVYKLVAAHELPPIDLSRSIQRMLRCCDSDGGRGTASIITSSAGPGALIPVATKRKMMCIDAGYLIGVLLCIIMPWLPVEYGRPVAIAAVVLALPGQVVDLRRTRYDIVLLLVKMYDFWFFTSVNTVSCVLLALHFNDARAIIVLLPWMGNLISTLVDANTHTVRHMIVGPIIGTIICSSLLVCVQFRLINAANHFAVAEYGDWAIVVEDAIVNGLATNLVLLSRNIYRRITDLAQRRQQTSNSPLVQCINYHCTIKLQLVRQQQDAPPPIHTLARRKSRLRARSASSVQMMYVREDAAFDAADTFLPIQVDAWGVWHRVGLRCIFSTGMLLPAVAIPLVSTLGQTQWVLGVAFACTQTIATLTWALSQKQLYWKIVLTFDYLFLSFQISSMHACACDMVSWNVDCIGIVNLWLGMHVMVTLDALPPVTKKKIGLNPKLLALPVVSFIVLQVVYLYNLAVVGGSNFQNRRLFHVFVGNRQIEVRVMPFFISRLSTTFVWSFRLLWRIFHAKDDELVLLRGRVTYEYAVQSHAVIPVSPSD